MGFGESGAALQRRGHRAVLVLLREGAILLGQQTIEPVSSVRPVVLGSVEARSPVGGTYERRTVFVEIERGVWGYRAGCVLREQRIYRCLRGQVTRRLCKTGHGRERRGDLVVGVVPAVSVEGTVFLVSGAPLVPLHTEHDIAVPVGGIRAG